MSNDAYRQPVTCEEYMDLNEQEQKFWGDLCVAMCPNTGEYPVVSNVCEYADRFIRALRERKARDLKEKTD